jgi:lipoprotein NlpI
MPDPRIASNCSLAMPRRQPQAFAAGLLLLVACTASGPDANALNSQSVALLGRQQLDSAIAASTAAIAAKPDFADAYRNRGRAYRGKGDVAHALQDLDRAIALAPGNAAYYNDRGLTYQMAQQYEQAASSYSEALTRDSTFVLARKSRGRVEFFLGRFADAARDLEAGRRVDSTNAYLAIWLHFINRRLGQDDAKEFAAQVALTDTVRWPAPVAKYYLGRLTAEQLMAVAAQTDSKAMGDQRCAVDFYTGEVLVWQHRIADAIRNFERTRDACPTASTEYEGAVAELRRLAPAR